MKIASSLILLATVSMLCVSNASHALFDPQQGQRPAPIVSPEVSPDRHITFRLMAPKAETVRLNAGDIPGMGPNSVFKKSDSGLWEATVGPVPSGSYRYTFVVDGVTATDSRNPATSESVGNSWSVVNVPGNEWMDTKNVPHGAVAAVTYYSNTLSMFRRMHVYTPPGYENGKGKFPVFYLLHGAGDSDDSWTSVGRAGFILDNLIAAGKAKPMIVVMPAGHPRGFGFGPSSAARPADEFEQDFLKEIAPTVEKSYRTLPGRANRAIAGLSMGGGQTLNLAIPHQEMFGYVGVFSSGLFNAFSMQRPGAPPVAANAKNQWEEQHAAELDNAEWKKGLKLCWFSTGKDDFLLQITHNSIDLLKRHGFNVEYEESQGGHTWLNWRDYLIKFAPRLFR